MQLPGGKPGGGVSSHILGGITRKEDLPSAAAADAPAPLGSATKDRRYAAASAPSKQLAVTTLPKGLMGIK